MQVPTPFYPSRIRTHVTQTGMALTESLLALLPILLIGSLCLELARGYQVRHLLTLALQEAARVAAVHQGEPQSWQPVLRIAISRLFIPAGGFTSPDARHQATREAFQTRFNLPLWQVTQVGSDADTIHLRLTYLYRPMQEWLRILLQILHRNIPAHDTTYQQAPRQKDRISIQAWEQGLIPLVIEYRVVKQPGMTGRLISAEKNLASIDGKSAVSQQQAWHPWQV